MTDKSSRNLEVRLTKAKTKLTIEHPFIATIALNFEYFFDDNMPTAAVNGVERIIYINPQFCDSLSDSELVFVVAHECSHPMLGHHVRRGKREPRLYNCAGDYVINQYLHDEEIGSQPIGGLFDPELFAKGDGLTEKVYELLLEDSKKPDPQYDCNKKSPNPLAGDIVFSDTGEGDAVLSESDIANEIGKWKVSLAQAAQTARIVGKMSANTEIFVGKILKPKAPWQDILHKFVSKCQSDERTWSRCNRRFISQNLYLPSTQSGESLGEIAFNIDVSGSIREKDVSQFVAEVKEVKVIYNPTKLHVIYFDSGVTRHDVFTADEDVVFRPIGGGGTAFSPVFDYLSKNEIEPVACIFLTDLCCYDFGSAPPYPVLWVTTDETEAPFGEIIPLN